MQKHYREYRRKKHHQWEPGPPRFHQPTGYIRRQTKKSTDPKKSSTLFLDWEIFLVLKNPSCVKKNPSCVKTMSLTIARVAQQYMAFLPRLGQSDATFTSMTTGLFSPLYLWKVLTTRQSASLRVALAILPRDNSNSRFEGITLFITIYKGDISSIIPFTVKRSNNLPQSRNLITLPVASLYNMFTFKIMAHVKGNWAIFVVFWCIFHDTLRISNNLC